MTAQTMKAVTQNEFGGPDVLHVITTEKPQPLPTEVLVRVVCAGVNPVDTKTRAGSGMAGVLGDPPFTLGWDVSGVVEETGFGVHTLEVGDEVYGMPWFPRQAGAYAEYVTAPARHFARKPATLDHEHAAAVPLAALTAWQSLVDTAHVTAGQRVLVHAAGGGVGHFAVQFAKHLGAYVIGTAGEAKHEWLRGLGADELIDYTKAPFEDAVSDVDVVIDLIGDDHDHTGVRSLRTMKRGGHIVEVPSGVSDDVSREAAALGIRASSFLVEPDGHALAEIGRVIDQGAVVVEVEEVFPLERAAEAHRRSDSGHSRGKLVLRVTD
ncbi:NADPH:quinone reductase [Actinacidiphila alni]|uniref:NADPH:quinone reductase n=1 Tax=Actinacidiphila alni TaxID=380248 RepID=A0A1I2J243_9ACTN|nr:NADP-dependent oxidoreductase [Actinacidiphila alni]SFF47327.1 NADPH:quinone reductase [Actinacidiphila alni]